MKTRVGFVSNSSSSSFIVISKDIKNAKVKIETPIEPLIRKEINTILEVKKFFIHNYYWSENHKNETLEEKWEHFMTDEDRDFEHHRDNVTSMLNAILAGRQIAVCLASSDDGGIGAYLYENEDLDGLNVEGGTIIEM